jgi:hypothetical protein
MKSVWPWIFGIAVGLIILALLFGGGSDRQEYWVARGTVPRAIQELQVEGVAAVVRFPCHIHEESIETAGSCAFYVWKK